MRAPERLQNRVWKQLETGGGGAGVRFGWRSLKRLVKLVSAQGLEPWTY